jgi:uncharacterized membrane protein
MEYSEFIELIGRIIEVVGIGTVVIGALVSTCTFIYLWLKDHSTKDIYKSYRQNLGRAILLGLEFLIAGDIIRSVAIRPTFSSVGILAIIVVIRSFLAIELEMEIEGKWPWQHTKEK